ncbi:MAG: hypothetical protein K8S13_07140 [Desulfobacula sp.]|uniref:hypothetical protein n=1 Tax=Desulfobacula sp. TaxID=2593537 RepID=UPI0025BF3C9E|nr:hypothetical protein [Desulfobacula sp.]MCD4719623.1 hypothetical protein [Desulfobacula sp.]
MLGFGKKKKKDKEEAKASEKDLPEEKKESKDAPDTQDEPEKKKKKLPSKKLIFIALLILIAVGASSYIVYTLYFTPKDSNPQNATYKKLELKHINLPEEMLRFSFDYFPDLYVALILFNSEMTLFDKEIARIDAIAQKYPDQKKIADKEKKTWGKAKNTLQKAFLKIEKSVKTTYVLFRVNKEQGLTQIEAKSKELTELAQSALAPARELTQKLKSNKAIPKGFIKGNIDKLKKKFL